MDGDGANRKKVYISGPMRGMENYNRPKFNKWEIKLRAGGLYEPVNPMKIGDAIARPEDIERNPELVQKVLDEDIRELASCDAIFMLDGWEKSEGAMRELQHALANRKDILLESEFLKKEERYDAKDLSLRIERFANRFGVHEDLKRLAVMMTETHKTLIQAFTSGFIIQFVKKMAENCREDKFDDRDKLAAKVCEEMWTSVEDKYGLNDGEDIRLPMI